MYSPLCAHFILYVQSTMCSFPSVCTVHGFSNAFYDVEEGERLDMVFKVNVKGTTGFSSLLLAGNITSAAGPNTSEFYYILSPQNEANFPWNFQYLLSP